MKRLGTLSVVRAAAGGGAEVFLTLAEDGSITAFNGHVDLGTGIKTALAQIVAEELDVPVERITMVLGDTASVPDQGPTIASETIQITAAPLRRAAAQARQFLLELAAQRLNRPVAELRTAHGTVMAAADGDAGAAAGAGDDGSARDGDVDAGAGAGAAAVQTGALRYEELLVGRQDRLSLSDSVRVKAVADYRIVGRSVQRIDIAAKAAGEAVFVHDVRVPSMLHGRVVRPPYAGLDSGPFVGTSLVAVDESSLAGLPGIVAVVVIRDFVGIVAEREEQAEAAALRLAIEWKPGPVAPNLEDVAAAVMAQPGRRRVLVDRGDVDRRIREADQRLQRTYVWPYQLHASIGPSCAVADWGTVVQGQGVADGGGVAVDGGIADGGGIAVDGGVAAGGELPGRGRRVRIWSGTQNPLPLRADLALLLNLPESQIEIIRLEASGCYGRNCADDVAADAALLSRAVGRPVRVQLTREQEHLWEPKGAGQVMQVDGGLDPDGSIAAYDFATRYPSNAAPTLALLLTGTVPPVAAVSDMGDRTAIPPYTFEHLRVVVHDMAPLVRASWLRGVSALPNSFAHECYMDELAAAAGVDPVEFRLRHLDDRRAADLLRAVAERAEWQPHREPRLEAIDATRRRGQGVAYAQYVHGKFPGTAAAWSAWVAEVDVDIDSGEIYVSRVVVGQDTGLVINPAGVQHQIHGNVIQSISRTLKEQVSFDGPLSRNREWGTYPILSFPEVPVIQVVMMPRQHEPPLGAGESASVPSAAAIANAIFDATGVRLREPPFTPERVLAAFDAARAGGDLTPRALRALELSALAAGPRPWDPEAPGSAESGVGARVKAGQELAELARRAAPPQSLPRPRSWAQRVGWGMSVAVGLVLAVFTWRSPLPASAPLEAHWYSEETVARGGELAALGNCAECHTAAGGAEYAGGRRLETPFGDVYSTNITPDTATGIGSWSFAAFERAMRDGVNRDGRHLYPAFPYTAFARVSDHDLEALYAYLMSRPAVTAVVPATRLAFPFNVRPLLKFWNALFLRSGEFTPDPARSTEWNRGAYLVEGLGHCGACHSPRNFLGAEAGGARHLAGGHVDGWDAPALTALNAGPIAWSEAELYAYLRTGVSSLHGTAAGPMQAVTANLARVPDADVRAMAHYLASFNAQLPAAAAEDMARILEARALERAEREHAAGARLFEGACASCHDPQAGSLARLRPSLALNTNLHAASPNNVRRAILEGVDAPALGQLGAMPGFRGRFDERQLRELLDYLRARFASDKGAWAHAY